MSKEQKASKANRVYDKTFAADVDKGLSQSPKKLNSKYFYNKKGDQLFQKIMKMDEYYLTSSEFEIFSMQKEKIFGKIKESKKPFQLIEFGAGDGYKTKVLLKYLLQQDVNFEYVPIDISKNVLKQLQKSLAAELPDLVVKPMGMDYFKALETLKSNNDRKIVLFLGSNIGNFSKENAPKFLSEISARLNKNDLFLMGVDLKKDPHIILNAYNDKNGITKAFNINLLSRINEDLDADFDIFNFDHFPVYDPVSGATKSYLISKREQTITIGALNKQFQFDAGEPIDMEISQKYSIKEIENLAKQSNFEIVDHFYDCKHYYVDTLWTVNQ